MTNLWQSSRTRLAAGASNRNVAPAMAAGRALRHGRIFAGRRRMSIGVVRVHRAARASASSRIGPGSVGQVDSPRNAIIAPTVRYSPTATWTTLKATMTTATMR